MATADNIRFLRFWQEVNFNKIGICQKYFSDSYKWYPYNKGGAYRKWDARQDYIVNWENDGYEIKNNRNSSGKVRSHNYNGKFALKEGLTWTSLSSGKFSARYSPIGYMFDSKGAMGFSRNNSDIEPLLGLLNSKIADSYLKFFSPTLDFKVGDIILIPNKLPSFEKNSYIKQIVQDTVSLSHESFKYHETNWDFPKHPLV